MKFNESKWVSLDCVGEITKQKYNGQFKLKPYLTHAEKSDCVRLGERYYRGIDQNENQIRFLATLAFLKFHIEETDATWWKESQDGLDLYDEAPVYELAKLIEEIQQPSKKEETNE